MSLGRSVPLPAILLGGCVATSSVQPSALPEKLLCIDSGSGLGALLDFSKPDLTYWGGTAPTSAVDDFDLVVERTTPRGKDAVVTLVVRDENPASPEFDGDAYYTIFRAVTGELRMRAEPSTFDPNEGATDRFPKCHTFER